MPDSSIPGVPPDDRPFRDRAGGQPAIRLSGRLPSDLIREERDQLAERGQFLREQLDLRTAERDRLSDRVEEVTAQLREVTAKRLHLAGERDSARADRDRFAATLAAIRDHGDGGGMAALRKLARETLKGWPHRGE